MIGFCVCMRERESERVRERVCVCLLVGGFTGLAEVG